MTFRDYLVDGTCFLNSVASLRSNTNVTVTLNVDRVLLHGREVTSDNKTHKPNLQNQPEVMQS